jgi:hypothetical protein
MTLTPTPLSSACAQRSVTQCRGTQGRTTRWAALRVRARTLASRGCARHVHHATQRRACVCTPTHQKPLALAALVPRVKGLALGRACGALDQHDVLLVDLFDQRGVTFDRRLTDV